MIEGVLGKLKQLAGFPFNATVIAFFALLFWAFQYLRLGQDSTLSFLAYLAIAALAAVNLGLVHFNLARKT
ncbi:MAG TPA: hypothetical protein VJI67_01915, partial [archaeon]|nr:hypothetical protein [archaeon]